MGRDRARKAQLSDAGLIQNPTAGPPRSTSSPEYYVYVATTASSAVGVGEYNVALMDWRERSIKTLGSTLHWLLRSLDQDGVVVVWVDSSDPFAGTIQSVLRKCGLTVEAGAVRDNGTVVSACCREPKWRPRPL
jgi:hypothetical protein